MSAVHPPTHHRPLLCAPWACLAKPKSHAPPSLLVIKRAPLCADRNLVSSLPGGAFQGVSSSGVTWMQDAAFGTVLNCDQQSGSYVTLPGVTYGQRGPFALAVWAKPRLSAGTSLDYLLSHNGTDTAPSQALDPRSAPPAARPLPNQVQLYIPEKDHPDYGILRAIVHGASDPPINATSPIYLDSDGCVSDPGCLEGNAPPDVDNGQWHLLAITTLPQGGSGFEMYVDGERVSSMEGSTLYTGGWALKNACADTLFHLGALQTGKLHMCIYS